MRLKIGKTYNRIAIYERKCYSRHMVGSNQEELKMNVKLWLKANNFDYAWLAEKCFVTEATVRNWMARKPIPAAKEHIIREMI